MARKKMDKLSLDMTQCEKDGFGVHYGRWKATQEVVEPLKDETLPKGWKICEWCKKPFKGVVNKRFCDEICRRKAYYEKHHEKFLKTRKSYYHKKIAKKNA